jgi:hypothetical protein
MTRAKTPPKESKSRRQEVINWTAQIRSSHISAGRNSMPGTALSPTKHWRPDGMATIRMRIEHTNSNRLRSAFSQVLSQRANWRVCWRRSC